MSRIMRSRAYILICPYLDQMNGKCQNKSILILAFYNNLLKQRFCVGKIKCILIPLSRNLNKVWNMHAWFSFLLSVPSAWNWHVEFILIRFLWQVLQSVGYATIKNQSEQDALLPLNPIQIQDPSFSWLLDSKKKVSHLPVFSSLRSMVQLYVPEWHVGFQLLR